MFLPLKQQVLLAGPRSPFQLSVCGWVHGGPLGWRVPSAAPQPPPVPQVAVGPPYTCCPSRLPGAALPLPSNRGSAAWPPALCSRLRSRLSCCSGDLPVCGSAVPPGSLKAAVGSLVAHSTLRSPGPGPLDHVGHIAWCTAGARVHLWNWAESSWVPVPAWGLHGRTGQ